MSNNQQKNFSSDNFKDALSSFATGVTIVTAIDHNSQPIGITVNSFNSVSLNPPLILWSVDKNNLSAQAFKNASHFGVHILRTQQINLAQQFATTQSDKFQHTSYTLTHHGIPKIHNSLVCFLCKTWAVHEGGDHFIIVGEVIQLEKSVGHALVYNQGSYASSLPLPSENSIPTALNVPKPAPNRQ